MKNIKKRIYDGETLIGCWLNLGSTLTAEIVGSAGFDWALIDIEHGAGSEGQVLGQLQALGHTSAAAIVRVESYQRQRFHRVLDLGAEAVITGNVGPKAFSALQAGSVKVYVGAAGSVRDALEKFKGGELECVSQANVKGHWT